MGVRSCHLPLTPGWGRGPFPKTEPLRTAASLRLAPSQASPSRVPAGPTASWRLNRQRLTAPGRRSGPGTAWASPQWSVMPCTAPGSNAAPWGGPAAAAMHWRHESAPPQTPQHGRRRVGSPPAPCVLGARPAGHLPGRGLSQEPWSPCLAVARGCAGQTGCCTLTRQGLGSLRRHLSPKQKLQPQACPPPALSAPSFLGGTFSAFPRQGRTFCHGLQLPIL